MATVPNTPISAKPALTPVLPTDRFIGVRTPQNQTDPALRVGPISLGDAATALRPLLNLTTNNLPGTDKRVRFLTAAQLAADANGGDCLDNLDPATLVLGGLAWVEFHPTQGYGVSLRLLYDSAPRTPAGSGLNAYRTGDMVAGDTVPVRWVQAGGPEQGVPVYAQKPTGYIFAVNELVRSYASDTANEQFFAATAATALPAPTVSTGDVNWRAISPSTLPAPVAPLYATTGTNTNGAMTQAATTTALGLKVDKASGPDTLVADWNPATNVPFLSVADVPAGTNARGRYYRISQSVGSTDKIVTASATGAIVAVADTLGLYAGMRVIGTGFSATVTISSISGTNLTLSENVAAGQVVTGAQISFTINFAGITTFTVNDYLYWNGTSWAIRRSNPGNIIWTPIGDPANNNYCLGPLPTNCIYGLGSFENQFGFNHQYNIYGINHYNNIFGADHAGNVYGRNLGSCVFGTANAYNTYGDFISYCNFGNQFNHSTVGSGSSFITAKGTCNYVQIGASCIRVTVENCFGTAAAPFVIPANTADAVYRNNALVPSGAVAFTPITQNQYGTHPAFSAQFALNAYLLGGAATVPTTSTPTFTAA